MSKLKNPLFSLGSQGSLGKAISFVRRGGRSIVEKKPEVPDAKSPAQLIWRHMYQKAVALWHALSEAERQEWESLARPKHMTGFAWFVSQALKPNPGLYLPLQGGKMQGDIDMEGHWITHLFDPIADDDPATKKYHDDNLPPGPYTQGCRVYHDVHQSIPDGTYTTLSFNKELYDTDEMHATTVYNERITIKTAGIYLIAFNGDFTANPTGIRAIYLRNNAGVMITFLYQNAQVGTYTSLNLSTLWQCAVGDYFYVSVYQNSGNALNIQSSAHYSPHFMAQRIG